jgi:hypothetical protein
VVRFQDDHNMISGKPEKEALREPAVTAAEAAPEARFTTDFQKPA